MEVLETGLRGLVIADIVPSKNGDFLILVTRSSLIFQLYYACNVIVIVEGGAKRTS